MRRSSNNLPTTPNYLPPFPSISRGHSVSFTSCTGAIISLKPFCTRPTMRINPVGGGKNLEIVLECSGFSVVGSVGESNFAQDAVPIHQLYRPKTFPTAPLVQQEERKKQKQQEEETPFIEAWVKAEMGRQLPPPNVIAIQAGECCSATSFDVTN